MNKRKPSPFLPSRDPKDYKLTIERKSILNPDGSETEVCPTCDGNDPICGDVCWKKKIAINEITFSQEEAIFYLEELVAMDILKLREKETYALTEKYMEILSNHLSDVIDKHPNQDATTTLEYGIISSYLEACNRGAEFDEIMNHGSLIKNLLLLKGDIISFIDKLKGSKETQP